MLLIGIDEAGYGPTLGPLCHGYSAIRIPDASGEPPCLWALLQPAVMRLPAEGGSLAIDDSKKIHTAGGTALLRRGVLAFLNCRESEPHGAALLESLLPDGDRAKLAEDAWHAADEAGDNAAFSPDGSRALREALNRADAAVLAAGARALSARHFNAALAVHANKADASWQVIADQLPALITLARPGEAVHAVIDRQGGRKFYGARVNALFPGAFMWTETETPEESIYRVESAGHAVRIAFRVKADARSLPVALGSMAAKLARELCMGRFNGFFLKHDPQLKPTAGYYTDALRFLRDTQALRKKLGIDDNALIRAK